MKKTFSTLLLVLATLFTSLNATTQQVVVTGGNNAGTYNLSDLPSSITGATDIVLTGEDWTSSNITSFISAIKNEDGDSKTTLLTLDMSEVTLSGAFSSGFSSFLQDFTALTTVNLPSEGTSENVSVYMTFDGCTSLTTVTNFDKFTQISNLMYTFRNCSLLETITLPEGSTYSEVNFNSAFNGCTNLKIIYNFEKFTNLLKYSFGFEDCSSLIEVRLGTDPNIFENTYSYLGWTFDGTNPDCIKYLPSGVTDVPTYWTDSKKYTNFAVPFTDITITAPEATIEQEPLTLPTPTTTPSYAAIQDTWEIKKVGETEWSEYTSGTLLDISYDGASLRCSAKPYDVDNKETDTLISNEVVISVSKPKVITVAGGTNEGTYYLDELPSSIAGATDIVLTGGNWTSSNITTFTSAIKSEDGDSKSTLFTLDMSEITLSGAFSTAFQNFVQDFTALTTVNLPNEGISEAVSLYMTFSGCTSLTTVTNLDKLTQIRSFLYTFRYCSSLETITLSEGTTYSSIDLTNTFDGCSNLKTINNFEKFTNISCLVCTFQNCSSLLEVRFGTDPNTLGNTYSNIGWTFDGTNPDCIKYLPSGVTDVPTYWTDTKKYTNFAVPITLSDITAPDAIVTGESLTLPSTPSISPTYAARQNLKWEIKKADETGWSEYTTGTALDYSYNGALLRYSAQPYDVDTENPESTTSNEVEIIVEAMYLYFDVNEGDSEATEISVTYNSEIGSLPVVTKEGYEFIAWTIDNDTITEETIWQYKEDKTALAQWTINSYNVVAIANDGGTATVNGEEAANVNYGETAEFVAVADEDYIFVSWTNEDGEVVSEEETYTITVTYDLSLTANFVEAATSVSNVTNSNIVVSTNNNIITITGAEIGTKISIYTVNGSIIYNGTITSDVNYIPMNTTGLLLIKVDNYITKTIN